ncbi:MAG: hypothetical protein IJM81_02155 [Prevotella sp.]|nr:hypothetical protein [Prevotella sp.]
MKRLQDKIAGSRLTLPIVASICILLFAGDYFVYGRDVWIPLVGIAVSTLLIGEWSNSNALIRIYSSIIPCSFMVLSIMSTGYYSSLSGSLVQLCFIVMLFCLFRTYQDHTTTGWTFYAFFAVGIASMIFVQVLFFIPLLWVFLFTKLQAGSARTFTASLIGLVAPYWLAAAWLLYAEDTTFLATHFLPLAHFEPVFTPWPTDIKMLLSFAFLLILSITGTIHFFRQKHYDKIRTQMLYELLIILNVFSFLFVALQPAHADFLLRIITITTAPIIGHFLSLTRTKITNIAFIVIVLIAFALTIVNLWISLPTFS